MPDHDSIPTDTVLPETPAPVKGKTGLRIFRANDLPSLDNDGGEISFRETSEVATDGLKRLFEAGVNDGFEAQVIIDVPGFRLVRAWFKQGFPVPVHAHSTACLYYVIGGELALGTEILSVGDGVFVPPDTPYTFSPGKGGAEILEFRNNWVNDMRVLNSSKAYFDKAVASVSSLKEIWKTAMRPTQASDH